VDAEVRAYRSGGGNARGRETAHGKVGAHVSCSVVLPGMDPTAVGLTCISDLACSLGGKLTPDMIDGYLQRIDPHFRDHQAGLAATPSCPTSSSKSTKSSDPLLGTSGKPADRLLSISLAAVGRLKNPLSGRSGRAPPWETLCTSFQRTSYTLEVLVYVWSVCSLVVHLTGSALNVGTFQRIFRQLTPTERGRLFRYTSWVRKITGFVTEDLVCFLQVLFGLPTDNPFPNLRELHGWIEPALLHFLHRIVSPRLAVFSVYVDTDDRLGCSGYGSLTDAISVIPGTSLRTFSLGEYQWENASTKFKHEVSAMVSRCGPALNYLNAGVELSEQAILHVMQLPHLHTLKLTHESPPDITDAFLRDAIVLPSVRSLSLATPTAHAWLPFLNDLRWRNLTSTPTWGFSQSQVEIGIHSSLEELYCGCGDVPKRAIVRQAFAFRNLTTLEVGRFCPADRCSFDLTDGDLTALTKALPRLQKLLLGHPCWSNTCQTTFRGLLTLSINCVGLTELIVHFNTIDIVEDVKSLLKAGDPNVQTLRKAPKCGVTSLPVFITPLTLDKPDTDLLAKGLLFVFPRLGDIPIGPSGRGAASPAWLRVCAAISRLKEPHDPYP
jgi:hypothetical protein